MCTSLLTCNSQWWSRTTLETEDLTIRHCPTPKLPANASESVSRLEWFWIRSARRKGLCHTKWICVRRCLTLGARDFSSAVSGFFQVFIVTRAKSFSRGFAAREFGLRPKMCRPSANIENSSCTREKPLVPRVALPLPPWKPSCFSLSLL